MKKLSIFSFLAAALLFVSCQDVETPDLGVDEQWLQFGESSYEVPENAANPLVVKIFYAADNNPNGVTVNYTVTSSNPDRYEIVSQTGSVEIPAGEFSADILIDPVDNFSADGDAEITLELESDSGIPLGIAGEGIYNQTALITIIDDDCPVDIESFVGTYAVDEQFTAGSNAPNGLSDFFGESYQVELALVEGDETGTKLRITNSSGFDPYFVNGTVITLRTCTKTVSFDGGNPRVALFETLSITSTSYDENTKAITASGPLGGYGAYQFLLTKIESN